MGKLSEINRKTNPKPMLKIGKVKREAADIDIEDVQEIQVLDIDDLFEEKDRFYTVPDLVEFLLNAPYRASFVSFESETTPRMRKTVDGRGTPYNEFHDEDGNCNLTKVSRVHGIINFQYANSVNNQREREQGVDHEPFEPEPRKWGERIEDSPLVHHKGNYYLEVKVERSLETKYVDSEGNQVPYEDVEEYLYSSSQPSTQKTEKEIVLRDYKVENLNEIHMYGDVFIVNG